MKCCACVACSKQEASAQEHNSNRDEAAIESYIERYMSIASKMMAIRNPPRELNMVRLQKRLRYKMIADIISRISVGVEAGHTCGPDA